MNHEQTQIETDTHRYEYIYAQKKISRYTFTHPQRKNNFKLNPKPLQLTHREKITL